MREKNNKLNEGIALLTESYVKDNDRFKIGKMGYIGRLIAINDCMCPNDLAIIAAQIFQSLLNDSKSYNELESKIIEPLTNQMEIYIAAREHYDEQFISKILLCLVEILHYNTFLQRNNLSEPLQRLISRIHCTYPGYSSLFWSQFAFNFHYFFYSYQNNLHKDALGVLKDLEDKLFSLEFSSDTQFTEESKKLLQGAYVYNKCQLVEVGYTRKKELLEYSKNLLTQALDNSRDLLESLFSEQDHSLRV